MARFLLRFFFDAGSGTCLWSANDAARARFGYPVDLASLPLAPDLLRRGEALIASYDASVDWSDPREPGPWTQAAEQAFNRQALDFLAAVQCALGPEFEVRNEVST